MSSIPNQYDIGDLALLRGGFTSRPLTPPERLAFLASGVLPAGIGVSPSSVVCKVRKPDGTVVTPAVASVGNGVFTAEQALDVAGSWWYSFDGTGGHQASGERELKVRKQRVPR